MKNKNPKLFIIDKIEKVRKKNNINWMNLMKIAFKFAPQEAKKCLQALLVQVPNYP